MYMRVCVHFNIEEELITTPYWQQIQRKKIGGNEGGRKEGREGG